MTDFEDFQQKMSRDFAKRLQKRQSDRTLCRKYRRYAFKGVGYEDNNQIIYRFPNHYGASVIDGFGSQGLELMPVHFFDNDYHHYENMADFPLTYLSDENLQLVLTEIFETGYTTKTI